VNTCVYRNGSYLAFDRSAVVAVEINLGVVCFADESGHCFAFAVSLVVPQELLSVAHFFH
jgi:hypothetical protein